MSQLVQVLMAPRRRDLVTDPATGKPVSAIETIVLDDQQSTEE